MDVSSRSRFIELDEIHDYIEEVICSFVIEDMDFLKYNSKVANFLGLVAGKARCKAGELNLFWDR